MKSVRQVRMPVCDVEYKSGGEYLWFLSATSDLMLLFQLLVFLSGICEAISLN